MPSHGQNETVPYAINILSLIKPLGVDLQLDCLEHLGLIAQSVSGCVKPEVWRQIEMKRVDSLSVVVASWLVNHAKRKTAGLGDGCTNSAADRTSFSARLGLSVFSSPF